MTFPTGRMPSIGSKAGTKQNYFSNIFSDNPAPDASYVISSMFKCEVRWKYIPYPEVQLSAEISRVPERPFDKF